jgi:hypothetical protein
VWASVPPPAPVPMMMTSKRSGMCVASHALLTVRTWTTPDGRILSADTCADKMTRSRRVNMNNR